MSMNPIAEINEIAKTNRFEAGRQLVIGLMRGDPETFHLGYSIGNALMSAASLLSLTEKEQAVVAEQVVDTIEEHHSATRRPLVIVGMEGGIAQWDVTKHGLGTPRLFVLDYDRDESDDEDLRDFIDQIQTARNALMEYADDESRQVVDNMDESIAKYTEQLAEIDS